MLLVRSVCVLACAQGLTHTEFIVYVFLLVKPTSVRSVPSIRTFGCVLLVTTTTRWWLCNSCTTQITYYANTTNTHSHMWTHSAQAVFGFVSRVEPFFFCTYVFNALQIVASNTHSLAHTNTLAHIQICTHSNHISCCETFACLFVCYFTRSVSQPNVLFVLLCSCLFGNINVYTIHVAKYKLYRCREIPWTQVDLLAPKHRVRCKFQVSLNRVLQCKWSFLCDRACFICLKRR